MTRITWDGRPETIDKVLALGIPARWVHGDQLRIDTSRGDNPGPLFLAVGDTVTVTGGRVENPDG